jgi:hypothetical protein
LKVLRRADVRAVDGSRHPLRLSAVLGLVSLEGEVAAKVTTAEFFHGAEETDGM